jgi:hypothetical protein
MDQKAISAQLSDPTKLNIKNSTPHTFNTSAQPIAIKPPITTTSNSQMRETTSNDQQEIVD